MCTDPGTLNSRLILSGDPKQLGAVMKSKYAGKLGYHQSYMEYLRNTHFCYHQDDETGRYNSDHIVQLVENYRTHRAILNVASKLFYNDQLEAMANKGWTKYIFIYFNSFDMNFISRKIGLIHWIFNPAE